MTTQSVNRIVYLDVLRLIATFAVILLHVSGYYFYYPDNQSWSAVNIIDSLTRWAVPVFIMISGVSFLDSDRIPVRKIYEKYIPKLLLVYVTWNIFYWLFVDSLLIWKEGGEVLLSEQLHKVLSPYVHLWFLPLIVCLYLLVPLMRGFVNKVTNRYCIVSFFALWFLLCGICTLCFPNLLGPLGVRQLPLAIGYFVLGWYLARRDFYKLQRAIIYALGIIGFCVTVWGTEYFTTTVCDERFYHFLAPNNILMSASIFLLFRYLQYPPPHLNAVRETKNLLGVYLVHFGILLFIQRPLFLNLLPKNIPFQIIVTFIFVSITSFLLSALLNRFIVTKPFV